MRIKRERLLLAVCPFSATWRIVLEGRVAGSALPQTKHTDGARVYVAARTEYNYTARRGQQQHIMGLIRVCAEGFALHFIKVHDTA